MSKNTPRDKRFPLTGAGWQGPSFHSLFFHSLGEMIFTVCSIVFAAESGIMAPRSAGAILAINREVHPALRLRRSNLQ
jgi:hypothetical protein